MRKMTVLLFRDQTDTPDENMGVVGSYGAEWRHAPELFERINVVDEATFERLVDALRNAVRIIDYEDGTVTINDARDLLAELGRQH